jgi:tetracycline repressor-like protein
VQCGAGPDALLGRELAQGSTDRLGGGRDQGIDLRSGLDAALHPAMAGNAQHTDHLYLRNPGSLESLRPVYCGPVADTGPEGSLARTHQGKPGLPRGSNRLPLRAVQTSHRERLQRSVIAAVAETSYPAVTVADIVRGARVSRSVFYAHFADKEDCFLAAGREGARLMYSRMASATQAVPPDAPDEQVLRAAFLAFLQFLADEPPGSCTSTRWRPAHWRQRGLTRQAAVSPT